MDKIPVSTFRFHSYKVDYINYAINHDFQPSGSLNIQMKLEVRTVVNEEQSSGQVSIIASFFDDKVGNYPFSLDLSITGVFSLSNSPNDNNDLAKRIRVNGTTALFPFLRSTVADITKAANIEPLIMPLINIHALLEQQDREEKGLCNILRCIHITL